MSVTNWTTQNRLTSATATPSQKGEFYLGVLCDGEVRQLHHILAATAPRRLKWGQQLSGTRTQRVHPFRFAAIWPSTYILSTHTSSFSATFQTTHMILYWSREPYIRTLSPCFSAFSKDAVPFVEGVNNCVIYSREYLRGCEQESIHAFYSALLQPAALHSRQGDSGLLSAGTTIDWFIPRNSHCKNAPK